MDIAKRQKPRGLRTPLAVRFGLQKTPGQSSAMTSLVDRATMSRSDDSCLAGLRKEGVDGWPE